MIKTLFNRFSPAVAAAEAAGAALVCLGIVRMTLGGASRTFWWLAVASLLLYAFIRVCSLLRWYKEEPRYAGIELQFKKAVVPASYALAVCGAWLAALPSVAPLILLVFVLSVVAHVNVILIYLHMRDSDTTPVNYYSSGEFLKAGHGDRSESEADSL